MKRYLYSPIKEALSEKLVLLMGPRQSGKTTLSRSLYPDYDYFNYDSAEDRIALAEKSWDRSKSLIIFDELHKMEEWKRWLKGTYDKEGIPPFLLVTGSAKLDTYRKMGDSLAGRYFQYRLHPLDLKEITIQAPEYTLEEAYNALLLCGGFPEPFLKGSESYYKRWRKTHLDIILRQDLLDLQTIRDIQSIETLVYLLKSRVGSSVSYASLARDLERDINTVKRWLQLLENLYIIFRVTPYHQNIARALLKEPKYYFFDIGQVDGGEGAKLENLVAASLLKELSYLEDIQGVTASLHYVRTKDGKEIDFLICIDNKPTHLIEVKLSDDTVSPAFSYFLPKIESVKAIQLVKNLKREKTFPNGIEVRDLVSWLAKIDLSIHSEKRLA